MEGRLPDALVACVGGGSNSIGLFHPFIEDKSVTLLGILDAEAKKQGAQGPGRFAFIIAAHKSQWAGRLVRGPQSEPGTGLIQLSSQTPVRFDRADSIM